MNETFELPNPGIELPIAGAAWTRPDPSMIEQLYKVSSATASAYLHKLGIRQTYIEGPRPTIPGTKMVGPAVTLQFMPQREDIASGVAQEEIEKRSALWHVLDTIQNGDVLVIAAKGDAHSGCLGEMLITYLKGKGGIGAVVDGRIRDWTNVQPIGLPLWVRGLTPNYASQAGLFPWAHNVPVDCANVLVLPGDIIIADDDGVVLIPIKLVPKLLELTLAHEDWESFSRQKLAEGGSIWKYYPLSDEGRLEYETFKASSLK
jgi:regulator of RNase E activity RraA